MRNEPLKHYQKAIRIAATGLAVLLGLVILAPAATARPQAATAPASDSLDVILKDLASYKFDQGVGAPLRLRAYVFSHKDDPAAKRDCEAKLLAFLQTGPAPGGTMAACRSLSLIGSAASVPVLEGLLLKPETTDPARYALERIPGEEIDRALLNALGKAQGDVKRGIVSTLGRRAAAAALPALEKIVGGNDPNLALDAVKALGRIGTTDAARVLTSYVGRAKGPQKGEAASALLLCAGAWRKAGKTAEAAAVYEKLLAAGLPDVDRQAAFRGKLAAAGRDGQGLILKTLAGKDTALYAPAIAMIHMAFTGSEIGQVLPFMSKLPEDAQVQLTAVLAGYPAGTVLPIILKAADAPLPTVRMEALRTIGKIGNASVVEMLANRAAQAVGDEQSLARETLARLKGTDVETAILDQLKRESDDKLKAELIQAVGERRIAAGKPVLMEMVRSAAPSLRLRAIGALKDISAPADLRDLLGLLFTITDDAEREAMQDTVASVALTIPRPLARGEAAENLLAGENDPKKKADLLRVLGKIGDDSALPLMRRALADPDKDVVDAAVRGLADWPATSARDDVFGIAAASENLTHKVLALRAFVRMIGLESYRQPEASVADLEKAMALASRPEEKKLVLGLLPRFPCEKGLRIAESLQNDPAVRDEAKTALDRIRESLGRK
ncbi:MAG: HEAT repeat domain-containing protein [Candidatus Aminicenantales bacterium]|jgi:HEAT repeat protein